MANFKINSRYTNGLGSSNRSNKQYLILRKPVELDEDSTDIYITLTQEYLQRPDLIASEAYGNADLWWVICEINGIRDPFTDLTLGQVIRIPSIDRVIQAIEQLGQ